MPATWNWMQVETAGSVLHPTIGPGGLDRDDAKAFIRRLLVLEAERTSWAAGLVDAWDAGARDDTVYAGRYLWCIYASDDPAAGARVWVDDLVETLTRSGARVRVAW
jgi:hypothetical protein